MVGEMLGKGFERVLRWVYPSALFIVLFGLGWPDHYTFIASRPSGWIELIIIGIVGGFIAYFIQGYVFTYAMQIVIEWKKCDWLSTIKVKPTLPKKPKCLKRYVKICDEWAEGRNKAYSNNDRQSYLNYYWGIYHAIKITGWLPLIIFGLACWSNGGKTSWMQNDIENCPILIIVLILWLLMCFWGFLLYILTVRMSKQFSPNTNSKK